MNTAEKKNAVDPAALDKQIRRAKAVLRELKATLEDLEDRRELAAAKARNTDQPGTSLRDAARELGL